MTKYSLITFSILFVFMSIGFWGGITFGQDINTLDKIFTNENIQEFFDLIKK